MTPQTTPAEPSVDPAARAADVRVQDGEPAWFHRLIALVLLIPPMVLLGIAASLTPDPAGVGTHRQLGLSACATLTTSGMPCPTCGMTTAFAHAAHGQIFAAFRAQPAGAVLAIACACAVLVTGYALLVALPLTPLIAAVWRPRSLFLFGLLVVAAWVYKVLIQQHLS